MFPFFTILLSSAVAPIIIALFNKRLLMSKRPVDVD